MSEQAVETINEQPLISSVGVKIDHPVYGKLTRLAVSRDTRTELYRDEATLLYLFTDNFLRATFNPNFWHMAELSIVHYDEIVQIRSQGQGIINIPINTELVLQTDFADVIDA